jgi:hypothetical protein
LKKQRFEIEVKMPQHNSWDRVGGYEFKSYKAAANWIKERHKHKFWRDEAQFRIIHIKTEETIVPFSL